jgi:hypothetical protein
MDSGSGAKTRPNYGAFSDRPHHDRKTQHNSVMMGIVNPTELRAPMLNRIVRRIEERIVLIGKRIEQKRLNGDISAGEVSVV